MRKVFLDDLPVRKYGNKEYIDWKNSAGKTVNFVYDKVIGEIKINSYNSTNSKINIYINGYTDECGVEVRTYILKNCNLGLLLNQLYGIYKYEVGSVVNELVILEQTIHKKKKAYVVKCIKDGWVGTKLEYSLVAKKGCPLCCHNPITITGYNDIFTTDKWAVPYFKNIEDTKKYSMGSGKYFDGICPECGTLKKISPHKLKHEGFSCPKCSDGFSYPNKFMYNILEQLNVNFIRELSRKTFDWCDKYYFDFYFKIEEKEYIIEMDGGLGHGYNSFDKKQDTIDKLIKVDAIKNNLAIENGVELIRIDCNYSGSRFEYIKDSINNSVLTELFDLSVIDWDKCDEYSCSTRIREVCDLWNLNHNANTIVKITKLSLYTVYSYLKIGSKFLWCDYCSS
jgi:hypothetical protein